MTTPDWTELQRLLQPINLAVAPQVDAAASSYFRYYGIDFEQHLAGVRHWFGYLSSGAERIALHVFMPAEPEGTSFILHGYFDHVGLYRHVIEYCLRRGLAVVAWDLPGHGLSTGEQATITRFAVYGEVLEQVLQFCSENHLPHPWRGVGQSTGGAILMDYLLTAPQPALEQNVLLAPLVRAASWQGIRCSHALGRWFLRHVPRQFSTTSGDRDFLEFIAHRDPLQARVIPVAWVSAMLAWERQFQQRAPRDQAPLVIQGRRDGTVAWRYNLRVIRSKFPRATVVELPEARHHLVNETPELRQQIFAAIDRYWNLPAFSAE